MTHYDITVRAFSRYYIYFYMKLCACWIIKLLIRIQYEMMGQSVGFFDMIYRAKGWILELYCCWRDTFHWPQKKTFKGMFSSWKIMCIAFMDRKVVLLVDFLPQNLYNDSGYLLQNTLGSQLYIPKYVYLGHYFDTRQYLLTHCHTKQHLWTFK